MTTNDWTFLTILIIICIFIFLISIYLFDRISKKFFLKHLIRLQKRIATSEVNRLKYLCNYAKEPKEYRFNNRKWAKKMKNKYYLYDMNSNLEMLHDYKMPFHLKVLKIIEERTEFNKSVSSVIIHKQLNELDIWSTVDCVRDAIERLINDGVIERNVKNDSGSYSMELKVNHENLVNLKYNKKLKKGHKQGVK